MRTSTYALLLLATLAACSSPPTNESDWTAVQRDRLLRLYQVRDPAAALAELRQKEPGGASAPVPGTVLAAAQEPGQAGQNRGQPQPATVRKHLDQILPEVAGPRDILPHRPTMAVSLDAGLGRQQVTIHGSRLDDRADAVSTRLLLDGAVANAHGPALQLRALSSDDTLFDGQRISDGFAPADADARVRGLEAFPHVRFLATEPGDLAVMMRAGLFVDWLELDHRAADVQRSWLTIGPRLLVEPRLLLLGEDDHRFEGFLRLGADLGLARFEEDFRGNSSSDFVLRGAGAAGVGVRYQFGRLGAELGYELEHAWYGGVTSDLLGEDRRTETGHQRVFLGFTTRF